MKTFRFGFLLSLFALLLASCSSDDNSSKGGVSSDFNHFTFDGVVYPLKMGFIGNDGDDWSDDGSTEYYIDLYSTEIMEDSDGDFQPVETIFSSIDFEFYSKDSNKPKVGRYEFNSQIEKDFHCVEMSAYLDMDYESDDDWFDEDLYAIGGYLEILQSGKVYELKFEFINFDGKPITGYYKGSLLEEDDY